MKRFHYFLLLTAIWILPLYSSAGDDLPEGFVYIKDHIPSIILEMRYYTEDNFVGERIDGYERPHAILTKKATMALRNVQVELNAFGLGLKLYDAYRPKRAVSHFVRWAKDIDDTKMKAQYYPKVDKKNLFRDGYIADRSSHSRGSSVDVTIVSLKNDKTKELDMGSSWDLFGPISWPSSKVPNLSQRSHRMLLQMLMVKHGFKPLKEEWWHFTYGDEPYPNKYFDFIVR